jgi:hypothetical protein
MGGLVKGCESRIDVERGEGSKEGILKRGQISRPERRRPIKDLDLTSKSHLSSGNPSKPDHPSPR